MRLTSEWLIFLAAAILSVAGVVWWRAYHQGKVPARWDCEVDKPLAETASRWTLAALGIAVVSTAIAIARLYLG